MRVLAVTPWFPSDQRRGLGLFNLRDVELLARDHEVTVLHLHDPSLGGEPGEWETEFGVRVRRIIYHSSRPRTFRPAAREIRALLKETDLLHTMAFPALFPARLARARAVSVPWVHTEHWSALVVTPSSPRARLGRAVLRSGLKKPDSVVAVGSELARVIDASRNDPTRIIGNRVLLAPDGSRPATPESRGQSPLRIAAIGGLIARKGPVETVEAIAALRGRGIPATLRWAGIGPLESKVLDRAAQLGVADDVELLGHIEPSALPELLLSSHLFMMPTEGETFGVSFAEALGHGLPVVTSGIGGHLDFLRPEVSRVVETRSGAALADAAEELIGDPGRWTPDQIANYARDKFSEDTRRIEYAAVYESARRRVALRGE